jgi:hypothetical protein
MTAKPGVMQLGGSGRAEDVVEVDAPGGPFRCATPTARSDSGRVPAAEGACLNQVLGCTAPTFARGLRSMIRAFLVVPDQAPPARVADLRASVAAQQAPAANRICQCVPMHSDEGRRPKAEQSYAQNYERGARQGRDGRKDRAPSSFAAFSRHDRAVSRVAAGESACRSVAAWGRGDAPGEGVGPSAVYKLRVCPAGSHPPRSRAEVRCLRVPALAGSQT